MAGGGEVMIAGVIIEGGEVRVVCVDDERGAFETPSAWVLRSGEVVCLLAFEFVGAGSPTPLDEVGLTNASSASFSVTRLLNSVGSSGFGGDVVGGSNFAPESCSRANCSMAGKREEISSDGEAAVDGILLRSSAANGSPAVPRPGDGVGLEGGTCWEGA